jgi:feruloyl esterase
MDPNKCDFYYDALLCNTSETTNCLTVPQIDTLHHIYNDWVEDNKTFIYPHLELGSEGQWDVMLTGSVPNSLGYDYIRDFLLSDPTWQWQDMNYSIVEWADQRDPGDLNATNYNITAFYDRGGKLLQYHGYSDGLIPPGSSIYYYNHVLETLRPQGIELDSWFRLFMVPGMEHCTTSVNDAPW